MILRGDCVIFSINFKKLIASLLIPLAVGGISAFIVRNDMNIYETIIRPPLSPPSWIFPVVWTILYLLMGVSLYLVWSSKAPPEQKKTAFVFFALQLLLNFLWSPIFFGMQNFLLAFVVLVSMWLFTVGMIISFYKISKPAGILQLPYLIWLTFAGYLNFSIYVLNK